jgi:ABC transport system ATP-binding/permease protein
MALLGMRDVCMGFGGQPLLENINMQIMQGDRVSLLGRNGAGKSTLLKLISGDTLPDTGKIEHQQNVRINRLSQEVPENLVSTVFEVIANGFGETGRALAAFQRSHLLSEKENLSHPVSELEKTRKILDANDGWRHQQQIESLLSRMELNGELNFSELSAGLKRRVLLAAAVVDTPDILLLDEPTNHMDIDSIGWMENFLSNYKGCLVFVTHDRVFLKKLATRIMEIDRGSLTDWSCDYDTYLRRRQADLTAEQKRHDNFDRKLAREEAWIRQGIKARRTRNEGRVRALEKLRSLRMARRKKTGSAKIHSQAVEKSGKLVIEARNISHGFGDTNIIHDFSTKIIRGDKVGIVGPNGSGKTTLLKTLLCQLEPHEGTIHHGTRLQIAYFDQLRDQLDHGKSVIENLAHGNDVVTINGQTRHVIGYLRDFLFTPERARSPVRTLSGGERNRLLLAIIFTKPCNLLVLDEPTNDLDVETLELLEELLLDFKGTLLLVSHDRAFINNVVTSTLVFEEKGVIREYVGGYDDWLRQRRIVVEKQTKEKKFDTRNKKITAGGSKKLGFNEKRELAQLPERIEALEIEQKEIYKAMAEPDFYQKPGQDIGAEQERLLSIEEKLKKAYARWEQLEMLAG